MSMSALWSVTFSLDSASSIHIAARPSSRTSFLGMLRDRRIVTDKTVPIVVNPREIVVDESPKDICRKSGGCQYRLSATTHASALQFLRERFGRGSLELLALLPPMSRGSFRRHAHERSACSAGNTSSVHYEPSCDTYDTAARSTTDSARCGVPTVANWS